MLHEAGHFRDGEEWQMHHSVATNVYGLSLTQPLPYADIQLKKNTSLETIFVAEDDAEYG